MNSVKGNSKTKRVSENGYKYVDHAELHRTKFVRELLENTETLLECPDDIGHKEELTLFKAMHACACLLTSPKDRKKQPQRNDTELEELYRRIQDYLFQANIGLVYEMRRRSKAPRGDDDGLNSEGFWALYQAVRGFDPWRGFRFSTYACTSILRAFLLVARTESRRKDRIRQAMEHPNFTSRIVDEPNPEKELLFDRLTRAVTGPEADLTPTERFVIERRFLQRPDTRPETLEAIGRMIKVSKERVRQIELAGLAKLRSTLTRDPLFEAATGQAV